MSSSEPARVIACIFALAGFAVAVVAGLAAQNSSARVLGTAVVSMIICHVAGLVAGAIAERVVNDHVERVRAAESALEAKSSNTTAAAVSPPGAAKGR